MKFLNSRQLCKGPWFFLGLFVILFTLSHVAYAQSSRDTFSRLDRIENELQTLNRAVYRGERAPPPPPSSVSTYDNSRVTTGGRAYADLEVRLQQLETDLRQMRGLVEQQGNKIRQLEAESKRAQSDIEVRLNDLERNVMSVEASPHSDSKPAQAGSAVSPSDSLAETSDISKSLQSSPGSTLNAKSLAVKDDKAAAVYENAFSMLKNEQYEKAGQEFRSFLELYSDHVLSGNAKYWLGETYYVRGEYEQAARIFAEAFQVYPDSAKAPDNLLKLGLSLASLGSKDDACVALQELYKKYGDTPTPVIRRTEQEMARLGCSS